MWNSCKAVWDKHNPGVKHDAGSVKGKQQAEAARLLADQQAVLQQWLTVPYKELQDKAGMETRPCQPTL